MNSKNNNSKNSNLSREEINKYRETQNESEKFSIELKSMENDFDLDALEGWSNSKRGLELMSKLDGKFKRKFNYKNTLYTIGIILISIISIYLFYSPSKTITSHQNNQVTSISKKNIEKTDLLIPENIYQMVELPEKRQIKIEFIQNDLKSNRNEHKVKESQIEPKLNIEELPITEVEKIQVPLNLERNQEFGKEIYLHDVKLVDYRAYRSKPQIKTKLLLLNGTPASQENQYSAVNDANEWKTIEVPYIEYIDKTISLFAKGNNKKALTRLEQILVTYPDDINANFYSALCYYNLNEFEKAISSFEKCLNSGFNNFNEEAEWYLAKSLRSNGDDEKAKILFDKIEKSNSYYSKQKNK